MMVIPAIMSAAMSAGSTALSTLGTLGSMTAQGVGSALSATWGAVSGAASALTGIGGGASATAAGTGATVGTASANAASVAGIEGLAEAAGYGQAAAAAGTSSAAGGMSIGQGLSYASAGLSGMASYQQAKAQNAALEYNAKQAEDEADQTIRSGRLEEQKIRRETAQQIGEQRANAAASGVDPNVGSAVDQQATTKQFGEYDALTTRFNAQRQAAALQEQANLYRSSTVNPLLAGLTSTLSTGLTTLSNRNLKKLYS